MFNSFFLYPKIKKVMLIQTIIIEIVKWIISFNIMFIFLNIEHGILFHFIVLLIWPILFISHTVYDKINSRENKKHIYMKMHNSKC